MNCKVKISGKDGDVLSRGAMEFSDGAFKITYFLSGDKCEISFDGKTLLQKRRGATDITLQFSEGKKTLCTLQDGGFSGTIDVFTKKLRVDASAVGVKINLLYLLGDEECSLDFTATAD